MLKFGYQIRLLIILITVVGVAFFSGCAHFGRVPAFKPASVKERQQELKHINMWDFSGAISVTYNKKRDIARFRWVQNGDDYDITVAGPLNLSKIRMIGNSDEVKLWDNKKKYTKSKTPEILLQEQFGWQLPVSNIRYWILALPAPGKIKVVSYDNYGHLVECEQNGWQIKYSEFQPSGYKNIDLPRVVEFRRHGMLIKLKLTKQILS